MSSTSNKNESVSRISLLIVALILIRAQKSGRWRREMNGVANNHRNISRKLTTLSPPSHSAKLQHPNLVKFVFINEDELDKGLPSSMEYNGELWFVGEVRTLGDVHKILWKTDNKDVVMGIQDRKPVPQDWTQR